MPDIGHNLKIERVKYNVSKMTHFLLCRIVC